MRLYIIDTLKKDKNSKTYLEFNLKNLYYSFKFFIKGVSVIRFVIEK